MKCKKWPSDTSHFLKNHDHQKDAKAAPAYLALKSVEPAAIRMLLGCQSRLEGKSITSFSVIYKQQATNGFINHPGISSMAKWLEKRGFFFVLLSSCHEKLQWNLKTWSFTKENLLVTTELQYPFCGVDKKIFLSRWWWNKFLLSHKDRMEWMGFFFFLFIHWLMMECLFFFLLFVCFVFSHQTTRVDRIFFTHQVTVERMGFLMCLLTHQVCSSS